MSWSNYITRRLIMHFSLGWWKKTGDAAFARKRVERIRLLTRREFQRLFSEAGIYSERYLFMTKSFIAMR